MGPSDLATSTTTGKSYSIPKLTWEGSNWITWMSQTLATLAVGQGVTHHIKGTTREPPKIPTFLDNCKLTSEEDSLKKAEKCWDDYYHKATIKAQIFMTIPDSLFIEIQKLKTVKEIWDTVCAKYDDKLLTVKVGLQHHMYEMKCEDERQV